LLQQEADLLDRQQNISETSIDELQSVLSELSSLQERLEQIGAHAAESRAATILSGLQFTDEMQHGTTAELSGGWRMRVSLASALFIEPDLLM
jgi:ATP-binding cassette subfamily F protein 3